MLNVNKCGLHIPEMEFDNWDPGILSGVVELCIKLDNSSKFAVNSSIINGISQLIRHTNQWFEIT